MSPANARLMVTGAGTTVVVSAGKVVVSAIGAVVVATDASDELVAVELL
jgi:hypothetical protein